MDIVNSHINRRNEEDKSTAQFSWHLANLIGAAVRCPKEFPRSAGDYYPSLKKFDWRVFKERMGAYAAVHNQKGAKP